mgnify:CR=1 FL=1
MRTYLVIIDETEEAEVALRFAARRAAKTKGGLEILVIIPQQEFVAWGGVQATIENEAREHAEAIVRHAIDTLADMEDLYSGIDLGAITTSMTINSPAAAIFAMFIAQAEKAGVQVGDAIKDFAGTPVSTTDALRTALIGKRMGEIVTVNIDRAGKPMELKVKLTSASTPMRDAAARPVIGVQLLETEKGVKIGGITPGSRAESAGIKGLFKMSRGAQDRVQEFLFPRKEQTGWQKLLLETLVGAAVAAYSRLAHGNPTMLVHAVTAPNAVRLALPSLPRALCLDAYAAAWTATAAVVSAYRPQSPRPVTSSSATPEQTWEQAVENGGEHIVKLADTVLDACRAGSTGQALSAVDVAISLDA